MVRVVCSMRLTSKETISVHAWDFQNKALVTHGRAYGFGIQYSTSAEWRITASF